MHEYVRFGSDAQPSPAPSGVRELATDDLNDPPAERNGPFHCGALFRTEVVELKQLQLGQQPSQRVVQRVLQRALWSRWVHQIPTSR